MENSKRIGVVATALGVIGVFLAHAGDDIWKGAGRLIGYGDEVRLPPNVPGRGTRVIDGRRPTGSPLNPSAFSANGEHAGRIRIAFSNAVAASAERLARERRLNVRFEPASGNLRLGSSRQNHSGTRWHRQIDISDADVLADTPLGDCLAHIASHSEVSLERCVEEALVTMTGQEPAGQPRNPF